MTSRYVGEAFSRLKPSKPGLRVWRLKANHQVTRQSQANSGLFYTADCYVVLNIAEAESGRIVHIHVWMGLQSSLVDELSAHEVADALDDVVMASVITREVQGHESRLFADLFPNGIKYIKGSHDTEYKQFEKGTYIRRLFQVKGKRNVRITQVELSSMALNQGDAFVLDDEWMVYCWNGRESSKVERIKALQLARSIRDDLCHGRAQIIVIDSGVDKQNEENFLRLLAGDGALSKIMTTDDEESTAEVLVRPVESARLHRITYDNRSVNAIDVTTRPLSRSLLGAQACFILESESSGIFTWVGSRCNKHESRFALRAALKFIYRKGLPWWTPVARLLEGIETKEFRKFFQNWEEKKTVIQEGRVQVISAPSKSEDSQSTNRRKTFLPDDGLSGRVKVWRVEGFKKVPWPKKNYGTFYEGDCYLVLYSFIKENKQENIVYLWLGKSSSSSEKERCSQFAQEISNEAAGKTVQVKVAHGKEPEHFIRIFKGRMITLLGGVDSDKVLAEAREETRKEKPLLEKARNIFEENDNECKDSIRLFHIRSRTANNTRATQVPCQAKFLHSDDAFLLQAEQISYIWEGKNASEEEKDFAEDLACYISPAGDLLIMQEGYETNGFWKLLGGKSKYGTEKEDPRNHSSPRLFHCSNGTDKFVVKEIICFDQADLQEDDVMILDAIEVIFVWIGRYANDEEKVKSWEIALNFLATDSSGRTEESTTIVEVQQGSEPDNFKSQFDGWVDGGNPLDESYEDAKTEVQQENKQVRVRIPKGKQRRAGLTYGEQGNARISFGVHDCGQHCSE